MLLGCRAGKGIGMEGYCWCVQGARGEEGQGMEGRGACGVTAGLAGINRL